jgi:hypothetical protein
MGEARRRKAAGTYPKQTPPCPDVWFAASGEELGEDFAAVAGPDVVVAAIDLGVSEEDIVAAARSMMSVIQRNQKHPVILYVEGYDDDPREVYDIPKARAIFARFGELLKLDTWPRDAVLSAFEKNSVAALIKCGAWHPDPPITVTVG